MRRLSRTAALHSRWVAAKPGRQVGRYAVDAVDAVVGLQNILLRIESADGVIGVPSLVCYAARGAPSTPTTLFVPESCACVKDVCDVVIGQTKNMRNYKTPMAKIEKDLGPLSAAGSSQEIGVCDSGKTRRAVCRFAPRWPCTSHPLPRG